MRIQNLNFLFAMTWRICCVTQQQQQKEEKKLSDDLKKYLCARSHGFVWCFTQQLIWLLFFEILD